MKRLRVGLWLAAWSVWLWLGFGLYRELPRCLGPTVSRLPLQGGENVFGFLGGSEQIVLSPESGDPQFQTFDARTGEKIRDFTFPGGWRVSPERHIRTHGIVLGYGDSQGSNKGLHVINLHTGVTTTLSDKKVFNVAIHPKRPWIAFRESAPANDNPRSLVVVDWTTGVELFVRMPHPDRLPIRRPAFLGDSSRLAVPTAPVPPGSIGQRSTELEIWRIETPCRLEKLVRLPSVGELLPSNSERIALRIGMKESHVEVFDLDSGRRLFSTPVAFGDGPFDGNARLSSSGRGIMSGEPPSLWSVDDGVLRWSQDQSTKFHRKIFDDAFAVTEIWDQPWARSRLAGWNTVAVRELDDGRLRFRCWAQDASVSTYQSAEGRLGLAHQRDVHQLPLSINYRLLALCQTILALPLILVWALLKWRRKRKARLA
jgi:hypothetical protein